MPGVSRTQRAEVKYNVVFEFSNLGLHTAAITGNLGLVKYALDHGQPVNSVVDGILPLHAASFGGNELIVRYLIEHGADVNTPRLPRRYSTDKGRAATSALPVHASSGSTSLHFASTNGHTAVVLTLLAHGAHPDRADKHGITPEMVARQNGHDECADILHQWRVVRDQDLRDREMQGTRPSEDGPPARKGKWHTYCADPSCYKCQVGHRNQQKQVLEKYLKQFKLDEQYRPIVEQRPADDIGELKTQRRPSLPHAMGSSEDTQPALLDRHRRPSNASGSSSRRPRSAGNDAHSVHSHRVKSKSSLLSFFKRGALEDTSDGLSLSSSAVTSASASPAPASRFPSSNSESFPPHHSSSGNQLHQRIMSDTTSFTASLKASLQPRRTLSREQVRAQASFASLKGNDSSSTRPGILRPHGRSSSGGQPLPQSSNADGGRSATSVKALILQHSSSSLRRSASLIRGARATSRSPARQIAGRGSLTSLRSHSPSSRRDLQFDHKPHSPISPSSPRGRCGIAEESEEYGQPASPKSGFDELKMRLVGVRNASRRASVDSKASDLESQETVGRLFDCPFSINLPPPEAADDSQPSAEPAQRTSLDNRMRGNSLSSMITDISGGPPSSCIPTPALNHPNLPTSYTFSSSGPMSSELPSPIEEPDESRESLDIPSPRRHKSPQKIDIRSISSHAQAEALVQRTQQRILSMNDESDEEDKAFGFAMGDGHTPLSARLAALGESLAIQRRLKEEEEKRLREDRTRRRQSLNLPRTNNDIFVLNDDPVSAPVTRQFVLSPRSASEPQRPHTSDGPSRSVNLNPERFYAGEWADEEAFSVIEPANAAYVWLNEGEDIPPPLTSAKFQHINSKFHLDTERPESPEPPPSPQHNQSAMPSSQSSRDKHRERYTTRNQKLTKMGLPKMATPADAWKESPRSQRQHRFGGIKTLVQSLTGRA